MMIRIETILCLLSLLFQVATAVDFELPWNVAQYSSITASEGDTVTFVYPQGGDVWIHPTGNCTETGKIAVGAIGDGLATYNFTAAGNFTFASDVEGHCEMGQIITFTVLPTPSSGPSSTPTLSLSPTKTPTMAPTKIPTTLPPTTSEFPTLSPTVSMSEFPTITGANKYQMTWFVAKYGNEKVLPGDSVTFTYDELSDLWIHPSGDCNQTGGIQVGGVGPGTATYRFTDADIGKTLTFTSSVGNNCAAAGQIITFTVVGESPSPTVVPTQSPTISMSEFPTITGATKLKLIWFIAQYGNLEVLAGDLVTFTYDELSDVWIHPSGDCNQAGGIQVGGVGPGTATYIFTNADIGKNLTFTSSFENNCAAGQIITFTVGGEIPSPSIAPSLTSTTTTGPVMGPPVSPAEPSAAPVVREATTARATNLSQTLLGMTACDVVCQDAWIAQIFETTANYFSTADTNVELVTNTPKITKVDVPRMRRLQGGAGTGVTINYDHTFEYISDGTEDVEVNELAAQPLADEADRTKFLADLKSRGDSFGDLTGVTAIDASSLPNTPDDAPSPAGSPTINPDEKDDKKVEEDDWTSLLSKPIFIIGVGVGVLLLLIIVLICCRKKNKSGPNESAKPKLDSPKGDSKFAEVDQPDEEESVETTKEELIHIFAPPGKLGVVIDTPNDGASFVHAVKATSVIADRVKINDKLVAVDDEDVRAMTAVNVSKLIGKKSSNPSRKLTVLRTVTVKK